MEAGIMAAAVTSLAELEDRGTSSVPQALQTFVCFLQNFHRFLKTNISLLAIQAIISADWLAGWLSFFLSFFLCGSGD